MSLLESLASPACWEKFLEYKSAQIGGKDALKELEQFVSEKRYLQVVKGIVEGAAFPLPRKAVISKLSSQKKRTVYTYSKDENMTLKLLTHLLLRKYDCLFAGNLYSFRPGRTAKDAVRKLLRNPSLRQMYAYKIDVSNYFNSVPVEKLLPMLEAATEDDPELYRFLRSLLVEPHVLDGRRTIIEEKGIMAGTPPSAFYANLYLNELDHHFEQLGIPYTRYSDDIILFAQTQNEIAALSSDLKSRLQAMGLAINPDKEQFFTPGSGWVFLGFQFQNGEVDIAPATVLKLKHKMRRKTRALKRWSDRNGFSGEKAAKAFIRIFNRKLMERPLNNDLTWSYWFFSVISTSKSLHQIDLYAQDCIRYLISGTRTKGRFRVRYEDMKALGYKSLVHAYYSYEKQEKTTV